MSFVMYFRRIPEARLQHFIASGAEDAAHVYMQQDRQPFPYSIQHIETHEPDYLHGILDPARRPESIFWHVTEGATPLRVAPGHDPAQIYLRQVRYVTPEEVQRIVVAMVMLDLETLLTHLSHEFDMPTADLVDILRHPESGKRLTSLSRPWPSSSSRPNSTKVSCVCLQINTHLEVGVLRIEIIGIM